MLRKIGKVLAIILVIILCVLGLFWGRYQAMAKNVRHQYTNIKPLDMSQIPDGVYCGSFGDFLVFVKVEVKVAGHRIDQIKVLDQRSGPGYEALETVDKIIKDQSPKVDAVTGASGSSMSIMIAVNRALTEATYKK